MKGFKYLEIEFTQVYFNSLAKTVINHNLDLKILFEKFYT